MKFTVITHEIQLDFMCFLQISSFLVLILSAILHADKPQSPWKPSIVKSLPGYPGNLPFHLQTGYIGVGDLEQVQLFYYFIESERDSERDPLMLWLSGGPGCSAFSGLVFEIGPLAFNDTAFNWQSEMPRLKLNPYSWTKVASIIFLDSPVGTGFSYATTSEGYYSDDFIASCQIYEFLRKWLVDHDKFQNNPLYICGDSYVGKLVPLVVQEILNGNEVAPGPIMNVKGYLLGNPFTKEKGMRLSIMEYAHRMSFLSDELYESISLSCNAHYEDVDVGSGMCNKNLGAASDIIDPLYPCHILEPDCDPLFPQRRCRDNSYQIASIWANHLQVQQALHIREGTKSHWSRCNETIAYIQNLESSFGYHQNFTKESIRALIYSGDQDMVVPYQSTLGWIRKLNVPVTEDWRPWFVKGQVAGYTTKFSSGHYSLTYATVKGAGHTAPEYKPQECLHIITKWFAMDSL